MNNKLLSLFLFAYSIQTWAQTVSKTMLRLPDTGQINSYTITFGEDNDYTINPPYFIQNNDGTVSDSITGLMWQKADGGEMTIENALIYCDTLTLGNHSDWRLPDAHEAFSILNHQYANPALDVAVFTTSNADYWWSSDRQANDSTKVWVTNAGGGIGNHPKNETISAGGIKRFHVRAVRDVTIPQQLTAHFSNNGNGTITDVLTNLTWLQFNYTDTLTWEQALMYADTLTAGGYSDWRLPNIKELQSVNEESLINPSVDPVYFLANNAKKFWSSTSLPNQTAKAWYLNTQFGITTYDNKTVKHHILCVRGNQTITWNNNAISSRSLVFPNPFQSQIQLINSMGLEYVELTNSAGQLIFRGNTIANQDFSSLKNGIYFLKIIGTETTVIKIIKN